ncbi:hypothetical protein NC651_040493 [Populus alba x Populus x berolinensis]|nr:hypothetical protein NC651_040493 [Populus alba x Populus x berolinensis]
MGVKGFGYIGECTKSVGEKPEARGFFVVVLSEETSKGQRCSSTYRTLGLSRPRHLQQLLQPTKPCLLNSFSLLLRKTSGSRLLRGGFERGNQRRPTLIDR